MQDLKNILVIRLGALGDMLLCMKPFQDIRRAFPNVRITLLTTPPFMKLARAMPWFDQVSSCGRPPWWDVQQWLSLAEEMYVGNFDFVFDLQMKPRSDFYYQLFFARNKTPWSGSAKGCSHPRQNFTKSIHSQQNMLNQLRNAGVPDSGPLDTSWMKGDIQALALPKKYTVLAPGCSPHLPQKRWPPAHYGALAGAMKKNGLDVLVVGTAADRQAVEAVKQAAPFVRDLSGQTDFFQLASVLRGAALVVGNDTGPVFLAAVLNAPTLTLMSYHTDPVFSGPVGARCGWLKEEDIAAIMPKAAWQKAKQIASLV